MTNDRDLFHKRHQSFQHQRRDISGLLYQYLAISASKLSDLGKLRQIKEQKQRKTNLVPEFSVQLRILVWTKSRFKPCQKDRYDYTAFESLTKADEEYFCIVSGIIDIYIYIYIW